MSDYLLMSPYHNERGVVTYYLQGDTKDKHTYNKNRFGSEWIYSESNFSYNMNSYGYRMDKELCDVDFNNYYAFFGCSFTVGVGLPNNETFVYRIAKDSNVDYINGAIGGASPSLCYYNFVQLMSTAPKYPKCVIINWPPITRQCYWYENELQFKGPNFSTLSNIDYWNETYENVIMEESHLHNTFDCMRRTIHIICNLSNIKLFEFSSHALDYETKYPDMCMIPVDSYNNVSPNIFNSVEVINKRCARDVNIDYIGHPGIIYQDLVYDKFFEKMV